MEQGEWVQVHLETTSKIMIHVIIFLSDDPQGFVGLYLTGKMSGTMQ